MAIPATTGKQVSSLTGMQIGDFIPCRYTATSGAVGTFSEFGTSIAAEIPVAGTATPNGLFYFVKVDGKDGKGGMLIADRVVQQSISWDVLNAGKMIEGKPLNISICMQSGLFDDGSYSGRNKPFDGVIGGYIANSWEADVADQKGIIGQDFKNPTTIQSYAIAASTDIPANTPSAWTFEGSNDQTNWTVLDTQTGFTTWTGGQIRNFNLVNSTAYRYYRLNITACGGTYFACVSELFMSPLKSMPTIRSLSGGNSYIDANGNSVTTDASLGAWPPSNEWDTYIVNSDLGGKITKGDNNVWHWSGIDNFCEETPTLAIQTTSYRASRGNAAANACAFGNASNVASATRGFRPVLTYKE